MHKRTSKKGGGASIATWLLRCFWPPEERRLGWGCIMWCCQDERERKKDAYFRSDPGCTRTKS